MELSRGTRLGSYEILDELGSGGMGIADQVYREILKTQEVK